MKITQGSRWLSHEHKKFIVISDEVELDDGVWIYYRENSAHNSPREYSCFKDSFLSRFSLDANQG
jgi:hypothetical protein